MFFIKTLSMHFLFTPTFLKIAIIAACIFIALDLIWIAGFASKFYLRELGFLAQVEDGKIVFNLGVGLAVQAILSFGLTVGIMCAIQLSPSLLNAILSGAFMGFVIYFVYDGTNLSFVKNWSVTATIVDIMWGTAQGAMAGCYVYYLNNWLS